MKKNGAKDTVVIIFILSLVIKILGLLKDLVFSWLWGVSNISDAYVMSSSIPTNLMLMVTTGITTCFLPVYISIKEKKSLEEANNYSNKIINIIFIFCSFIIATVMIFTKPIVTIFASGFDEATLNITVNLTRITILEIFCMGAIAVYSGILQTEKKYYAVVICRIYFTNLLLCWCIYCICHINNFVSGSESIRIYFRVIYIIYYCKTNRLQI